MKIITIIGARPQFVKAAVVGVAIQRHAAQGMPIEEQILHTGQHYDYNMSELFFTQLGIPAPAWHLNCGNDTARMQAAITPILREQQPDIVLVYGDTNSTLAGARAAHSLAIPVAHIEAGLRSFNNTMPEEYNRIETDKIATWLFCPTKTAVENLQKEGITEGVYPVGDVMYDAAMLFSPDAEEQQQIIALYAVHPRQFCLATIHRASTAENIPALTTILRAFAQLPLPVLFPLHPHTAKTIKANASLQQLLHEATNIRIIEPVGYVQMLALEQQARWIITDSGGIQKEAYFQRTPCITLRNETEWVETVKAGWNALAGTETERILKAITQPFAQQPIDEYGDGHAAQQIIQILCPNDRNTY